LLTLPKFSLSSFGDYIRAKRDSLFLYGAVMAGCWCLSPNGFWCLVFGVLLTRSGSREGRLGRLPP